MHRSSGIYLSPPLQHSMQELGVQAQFLMLGSKCTTTEPTPWAPERKSLYTAHHPFEVCSQCTQAPWVMRNPWICLALCVKLYS